MLGNICVKRWGAFSRLKFSQNFSTNPFEASYLDKRKANYAPLSPVSFLTRNVELYPDHLASIHGNDTSLQLTWRETGERASQLGSALVKSLQLKKGDVVSVIAPNIPAIYEAHFALPGVGIILHTINTRLDATTIAYQLSHCNAKVVLVDSEYTALMSQVKQFLSQSPGVHMPRFVSIHDTGYTECTAAETTSNIYDMTYDELLSLGDKKCPLNLCHDEFDAIALNYTSGTTGNPKGVVTHHRGAYLNAISNIMEWDMHKFAKYLWVVPMFHCNGWCFTWTMAALGGTNVFLRQVRAPIMFDLLDKYKIDFLGGAPVVMNTLLDYESRIKFSHRVRMWTAGAPPPARTIYRLKEELNVEAQTAYGLTETYGPISTYVKYEGAKKSVDQAAVTADEMLEKEMNKIVVQTRDCLMESVKVLDPVSMAEVKGDGKQLGEVMIRGNLVMKGYLNNPKATEETFQGGWFRTGDIAVSYGKGRFELKDRSKDIIISGGENISSIEIETILLTHPQVKEVAVVAMPHEKWGEVPVAFLALNSNSKTLSEEEVIAWCRERMASFQAPKKIVFLDTLPKTSTGKVQKQELRKLLNETMQ